MFMMRFISYTVAAVTAAIIKSARATIPEDQSYNGLALTPQMGWNNWNAFACDVSEELLMSSAEKIVDWGLRDLGYKYVVLDDCWSTSRGPNGSIMANLTRFPDGMAHVANRLHDMELLFGMYSSAGEFTCAGYPGSLGYEEIDAQTFANWGIDYLKYDNCYNLGQSGTPLISFNRYKAMSDALNATGRSILYSICNWGDDKPWEWGSAISNSWRATGDIYDNFDRPDRRCPCSDDEYFCQLPGAHCNMLNIVNKVSNFPSKAQPGGWNDLDMLEVGNGGMSDSEYVAHMSLWAMMKSPLLIGTNLATLAAPALSIYMNAAVLAINQDPQGASAHRVWRHSVADTDAHGRGEISLWTGPLANGDQVVALLNAGNSSRAMRASLADIFLEATGPPTRASAAWDVHDLWANRMPAAVAQTVLDRGAHALTAAQLDTYYYNASTLPYAAGLARRDPRLLGKHIATLRPHGALEVHVPRHAVAMYRLRRNDSAAVGDDASIGGELNAGGSGVSGIIWLVVSGGGVLFSLWLLLFVQRRHRWHYRLHQLLRPQQRGRPAV